jgi:hypothetical protein
MRAPRSTGGPTRFSGLFLAFLVSGCAAYAPPAETGAMLSELGARQARIAQLAALSQAGYRLGSEETACPVRLSADPPIACFTAPVPAAGRDYHALYLIETDDERREQIVAIRGTSNLADVLTDLGTRKVSDETLGVAVHSGFRRFARAIYQDIARHHRLRQDYRIFTTGHSLGGVGALLLGLYLYLDRDASYEVAGVYTFGQPKVFDNKGATSWPRFAGRVLRVVDCGDPVPILPTGESKIDSLVQLSFFDTARRANYQHLGQSLLLMDDGRFWMPGGVEVERDLTKAVEDAVIETVNGHEIDHGMRAYLARLDRLFAPGAPPIAVNPALSFQCSRRAARASPPGLLGAAITDQAR